ncbi:MAG: hypothetical protein A2932_00940 [Candidatus Spechtbacteria bacterium RIFCSPLOWO2_01_FULL_46_10]|uniref:Fimbrial assembly protein n=1 Tax=Candidatus Spechtbacteria bacterium RIFCSPLOWO2_01_FULL_46_10 TaxID=1802163 RepID=A0A1G2HFE9_9BACT|nr:MAG: hypothetical protein A2932_00940 [Candidatus Spechtbacteria bacterium RIFCSPLOWO2_01_FULL_46_10]
MALGVLDKFMLNFLPQTHKKVLRLRLLTRAVWACSVFIVLASIVFGTIFFAGIQFFNIQNDALNERLAGAQSADTAQDVREVEEEITKLNMLMAQVAAVYGQEKYDLIQIVERIARLMPQGTSLTSLNTSTGTVIVLISGKADLRSQVIALQDNLEAEKMFAEVEAPLSNLLEAEDVDFKFTITLANK